MNCDFPYGCQYCRAQPEPMHDKCLNGKKTITTGEIVHCGCQCQGGHE